MKNAVLAFAVLFTLAWVGCSRDPDSPETAVRATLAAIEAAAVEHDVSAIRERISERYADEQRNDKRALVGLASLRLLRNQAVYTFTRIQALDVSEPGSARVMALVALAGRPIPDAAALATVHADLFRFDVRLREEEPGVWRVVSADWKPATLSDFL